MALRVASDKFIFCCSAGKKIATKRKFCGWPKNFRNFNFFFFAAAEFVDVVNVVAVTDVVDIVVVVDVNNINVVDVIVLVDVDVVVVVDVVDVVFDVDVNVIGHDFFFFVKFRHRKNRIRKIILWNMKAVLILSLGTTEQEQALSLYMMAGVSY